MLNSLHNGPVFNHIYMSTSARRVDQAHLSSCFVTLWPAVLSTARLDRVTLITGDPSGLGGGGVPPGFYPLRG